ncbi:MAG: hypothetical protein IJ735_00945 [Clostridia bacterium]|nr:hypothetical protein [Clostridia bacterium]
MNFIALTRSRGCEVVLINLDNVIKFLPDGDGTFLVFGIDRRSSYGFTVVETIQEIAKMIDDLKRGSL